MEIKQQGNASAFQLGSYTREALDVRDDGALWGDRLDQPLKCPVPAEAARPVKAVNRCNQANGGIALDSRDGGHRNPDSALDESGDLMKLSPLTSPTVDVRRL